jgi:hypothetical protein
MHDCSETAGGYEESGARGHELFRGGHQSRAVMLGSCSPHQPEDFVGGWTPMNPSCPPDC